MLFSGHPDIHDTSPDDELDRAIEAIPWPTARHCPAPTRVALHLFEMPAPAAAAFAALTPFAQQAIAARALLAATDPDGELDAVRPLGRLLARSILLTFAELKERRPLPARSTTREPRDPRELLDRLGADPDATSGRVVCPLHGQRDRNLAWRVTQDGRVLLTCHSHHCTFDQIRQAVA